MAALFEWQVISGNCSLKDHMKEHLAAKLWSNWSGPIHQDLDVIWIMY